MATVLWWRRYRSIRRILNGWTGPSPGDAERVLGLDAAGTVLAAGPLAHGFEVGAPVSRR